ncbi:MAG: MATE family efflux transporter, partial [Oscillospiraceae bacterium]|nr:MATE family efflux transporter [Oscillospiraceae bacterium]
MDNEIFERGKISTTYLRLATPTALNMVICIVYSMADTFFISQTQNTGMVAGVSLCAPVFILLMALGNFFTQGGSCLISRLVGEKKFDDIRRVTSYCFYGTLALGFAALALLMAFRTPMLHLLGATEETFALTLPYYSALALGAPIISLSFLHTNLMRSEGFSKENMIGTLLGAVVNIILDPILIMGCGMGPLGAGIATVAGYAATCIYALVIIPRRDVHISMQPALARISKDYVKEIIGISFSSLSLNVMGSVSMIVLNNFLVPYGSDKVASMGIALKLINMAFFALDGYSYGVQPIAGYFYGAGKIDKLHELLRFVFLFLFGLGAGLSLAVGVFARPLGWLFLKDPAIIAAASLMLRLQIITIPLVGLQLLITIIFQSLGKAKEAFVLSFARTGYVFIPVILALNTAFGYMGVISAQAVTDLISMLIFAAVYSRCMKKLQ